MFDNIPPENTDSKPAGAASDSDDRAKGREDQPGIPRGSKDGPGANHESSQHENGPPYGFANVAIGVVAALINAVLVGVLVFQTWAVYGQLSLSREALDNSNESVIQTIAAMREQGDALTAQVESVAILTSTLEQMFRDQQRVRLSFRVELDQIDDVQIGIRIVCPLEIGGTTEASQVRFKNYVSTGGPGQRRYLESLGIDWSQRESHKLRDVAPTEVGRQFVSAVLSQKRLRTVVSRQDSLYFVGRLEYCDVYGDCRYFMRCAELGYQPGVVTYCGTHVGSLGEYTGN